MKSGRVKSVHTFIGLDVTGWSMVAHVEGELEDVIQEAAHEVALSLMNYHSSYLPLSFHHMVCWPSGSPRERSPILLWIGALRVRFYKVRAVGRCNSKRDRN